MELYKNGQWLVMSKIMKEESRYNNRNKNKYNHLWNNHWLKKCRNKDKKGLNPCHLLYLIQATPPILMFLSCQGLNLQLWDSEKSNKNNRINNWILKIYQMLIIINYAIKLQTEFKIINRNNRNYKYKILFRRVQWTIQLIHRIFSWKERTSWRLQREIHLEAPPCHKRIHSWVLQS